uniref:Uncharacterized protein n=1 Tax=Latimeria chalumnae TaxID=7897 RepID=H3BB82_LATCH
KLSEKVIAWESVGAQVVNPINRINDGFLEDKGVTSGVLVPLVAVAGVDCIIVDIQVVVRRGVLVFKNVVSITGVVGVVASVEKSGFTEVVMASVVAGFGFVVISVTNEAFAVERLSTVEEASIVVEEETFSKKDSVVLSVKMSLVVAFTAKGMGSVVLAVENRVVVVCPVKRGVVVTSAVKEVDVGVAWDNLFASVAMKVGRISVEKGTVVVLVVERNCVVVGRKVPGVVVVEAMDNVLAFVPMEMVKMVLCEGGKEMGYVALAVENGKVVVFAVKMDLVVFAVKSVTVVVLSVKEIGFFMLAEENIGLVSDAVELNNTVLTGEDTIVSLEGMPVLLVENVALFSVVAEEIGNLVLTVESDTVLFVAVKGINDLVATENILLPISLGLSAVEGTGVVLEVVENDVLVSVSTDNGCVVLVLCVENGLIANSTVEKMGFVFSVECGVAAFPNMNDKAFEVMKESVLVSDELGSLVRTICDVSVLALKETEVLVVEENVLLSLTVMAEILEENGRAVAPTVENIVVVFTWKEMGCIVLVVKNGKMVGPIAEEFLLLVVVENVLVSLSSERGGKMLGIKGMGVSVILVNDILLSEEGMVVLATLSVISLAPGLEGIGVLMVAKEDMLLSIATVMACMVEIGSELVKETLVESVCKEIGNLVLTVKIVVVVVLEFASDCKVVGCPLLTIGSGIVVEYTVEGMVVVVEIVLILVSIVGLAIICDKVAIFSVEVISFLELEENNGLVSNVVELGNMLFTVKSGTMFLTAEDGMGVVLEVVENGLLVSVSAGNSCMVLVLCVENMNFVFSVEGGVAAFPNMNVMALEVMKENEVGTLVVFVCDASVLPLKETEVWVVEENVMASLTVVAEILVENGRAVAPAVKGIGVVVNEDNSLVSLDIGTDSVVLAVINVELSLVKLKLVDVALVKIPHDDLKTLSIPLSLSSHQCATVMHKL